MVFSNCIKYHIVAGHGSTVTNSHESHLSRNGIAPLSKWHAMRLPTSGSNPCIFNESVTIQSVVAVCCVPSDLAMRWNGSIEWIPLSYLVFSAFHISLLSFYFQFVARNRPHIAVAAASHNAYVVCSAVRWLILGAQRFIATIFRRVFLNSVLLSVIRSPLS